IPALASANRSLFDVMGAPIDWPERDEGSARCRARALFAPRAEDMQSERAGGAVSRGEPRSGVSLLRGGHFEVQQRRVLLRAEDVGVARAAARPQPEDRELDRVARIELDEIAKALGREPVELHHGL